MNKILLERSARHHIKIFPVKVSEEFKNSIPTDEGEGIRFCEKIFDKLESSKEAKKLFFKHNKNKEYLISLWGLDNIYYLVLDIKNEFNTYNSTIYLSENREDMVNISKFLVKNINFLMSSYKKQILDAKKCVVPNAFKDDVASNVKADNHEKN